MILEEVLRGKFPELTDADFDYHESDLYVRVIPGLISFVKVQGSLIVCSTFTNQRNGQLWLDIMFGNGRFWQKAEEQAAKLPAPYGTKQPTV